MCAKSANLFRCTARLEKELRDPNFFLPLTLRAFEPTDGFLMPLLFSVHSARFGFRSGKHDISYVHNVFVLVASCIRQLKSLTKSAAHLLCSIEWKCFRFNGGTFSKILDTSPKNKLPRCCVGKVIKNNVYQASFREIILII